MQDHDIIVSLDELASQMQLAPPALQLDISRLRFLDVALWTAGRDLAR